MNKTTVGSVLLALSAAALGIIALDYPVLANAKPFVAVLGILCGAVGGVFVPSPQLGKKP